MQKAVSASAEEYQDRQRRQIVAETHADDKLVSGDKIET